MVKQLQVQTIIAPTPTASRKPRGPRLLTIVLLLLALLALLHFIAVTHAAYPGVKVSDCNDLIRNTDYKKFIALNDATQNLDEVQFVDQLVGSQPAALVSVSNNGPQHLLDVYLYGCTQARNAPSLTLLFKKQGLVQGAVKVTQDNMLSIGEQDAAVTQDSSMLQNPLQGSIYREYAWHDGSFSQLPFAGLYPVTSRAEAETMQDQSGNGQIYPWTDLLATAQQMGKDILQLSSPRATIQDNNGRLAHVLLEQDQPHLAVSVTLSRLLQSDDNGLWFVTQAHTANMALDPLNNPLVSPASLHGSLVYPQSDVQTSITLFDHTFTPLHVLNQSDIKMWGDGSYSANLTFTNNVANQPGLLLIKILPDDPATEDGQLLLASTILG